MKKALFTIILIFSSFLGFSQIELAGMAANAVISAAVKKSSQPQPDNKYVTYTSVNGEQVPLKRTPPEKIKGKKGLLIKDVENRLTGALRITQSGQLEDLQSILPAIENQINEITITNPKWSVAAYWKELKFYQQTQRKFHYDKEQLSLQRERQKAVANQRAKDSITQLAWKAEQKRRKDEMRALTETRNASPTLGAVVTTTRTTPYSKPRPATKSAKPAKYQSTQSSSSKNRVFVCNSGNTVKFHSSSTCRGLNRCKATIISMSYNEAQSYMDGCKFCY